MSKKIKRSISNILQFPFTCIIILSGAICIGIDRLLGVYDVTLEINSINEFEYDDSEKEEIGTSKECNS